MKKFLLVAVLLACWPANALAQVVLSGGEVHVGDGTVIAGGTVVVGKDGKVAAVGASVPTPAGATVVDVTGKVVTPGFIDIASQLGLVEIWAVDASRDGDAGAIDNDRDAIRAAFRASDAFNPMAVAIPLARAGGVTSIVALPWGGLISGQGVYAELSGSVGHARMVDDSIGVVAALGARGGSQVGGSRGGAMLRLREALDEAKYYKQNRGKIDDGRTRALMQSRLDSVALGAVLDGEPLFVHVDRASDIVAAIALGKEYGLNLVLLSVREGWLVAKQIAEAKVPVVVYPTINLPSSFDALGTRGDNAALLADAGVRVALSTFDAHYVGGLRVLAGNAVREGLDHAAALRAVTSDAAGAVGLGDSVGTLKPGLAGNVVVWSGDPFEISTRTEAVYIGGEKMDLTTRQDQLVRRYRELKRRGAPAMKKPETKQLKEPEQDDVTTND